MNNRTWYRWGGLALLGVLLSPWALAVSTKFWSSATFEDFSRGNFSGVSLSREGAITLAPQLKEIFSTDQALIWTAARDQRGNIYLGTGHSGKVFRLGPDLNGSVLFEAPEPDVFALAVDKDNQVFVGTSPDGKIYKVDASGKGTEFFDPQAKYIWAMTFAPDGTLYVGTGDRGKIYRVRTNGQGELFYDTHQGHIMSLATTPNSDLIAGSEPNGLLYRFTSSGKASVLYDAPLAEIHRVAVAADGSIYISAMGGSEDSRIGLPPAQSPGGPSPLQTTTSITVRAAQEPGITPGEPGGGGGQGDQRRPNNSASEQPGGGNPFAFPSGASRFGEGRGIKSALYRISPDGTVETLWNSPRENAFDLLPSDNKILFSTDDKGRIYELTPDHRVSLLTQTDQEETTRLFPYGDFVLATTANLGKVFRVGTQPADTGFYESEVHDTGGIASWGKIRWTVDLPSGTTLELLTRSGNSGRPDPTWSDWSSPYRQQLGEQINSPSARYIQWKTVFHSAGSRSPVLQEVTVAYLPRNHAPVVTELKVTPRGDKNSLGNPSGGAAALAFSGNASAARAFPGYASSLRPAAQRGFDITWLANDPDQDELSYALYFRGDGEGEWKLLQGDLKQNYFQLDSDALPDGKYRLKIIASDAGVNPVEMAKTAEMMSAPFLVDNAPPEVKMIEAKRTGNSATARFRGFDRTSVLTRAEYALDAEVPVQLLSDDGIIDSQEESFTIVLKQLDSKEHLLTLRVYDSAGNMGVGKAVWPASSAANGK